MSSVLNSKFSHRFDSPIWETKSAEHLLLVNTRNNDSLESKFSLIDLNSGELKWEGLQFEDEWWVSAYHMTGRMVVFQKFEDSQDIDNRTVFGFDLEKQESVWSMENIKLTGANIGAATVVNGTDGMAAPDKYQSYMRSIMRSTAEKTGRDPLIAEGMVDDRVEIEGVTEAGKVITFTTSEALANGYCEAEVASVQDILEKNEIVDYELIEYELPSSEKIIAFFLNPVISGLLILVITGGIFFELQTPGVGFPLAAAGVALILYLVPYYMNGLAANWEIAVFFVGLILIALEVFVIPGFGVAGIAGS